MSEPTVCAIMITADRPEYSRRAVECFRRQTYDPIRRMLLIFDTGDPGWYDPRSDSENEFHSVQPGSATIGELRNRANALVSQYFDVILHWDSDDYSHPNRIAEQVALLQSSGADVVGYREMLFWREKRMCDCAVGRFGAHYRHCTHGPAEAWLYSNPDPRYCLGTSLCYWRNTWERNPFEATSQGEDIRFCTGLKCVGVSGINRDEPRMIARIHSGNTSTVYRPELMAAIERQGGEWKRVPEWDSYCRGVME